ncbi:MAG TPA: hypothetical protein VK869_12875 [Rubrobacteraceae bacterium]|nr:hypothetical protein [Rubrobacteraceae bacterium]
MSPQERLTTIAILGPNAVPEYVLMHLLEERENYAVRLLKAPPAAAAPSGKLGVGSIEALLREVDVVLVWPSLGEGAIEEFLGDMESAPATAAIPVLALSSSLAMALQDEVAVEVPLERHVESLLRDIEAALGSDQEGISPGAGEDFLPT